jgi:hypothetical protein
MAIPIKSAPVLEGKAAREFYERWHNFKDDSDPEEVKEIHRKWKVFFERQEKLHLT